MCELPHSSEISSSCLTPSAGSFPFLFNSNLKAICYQAGQPKFVRRYAARRRAAGQEISVPASPNHVNNLCSSHALQGSET